MINTLINKVNKIELNLSDSLRQVQISKVPSIVNIFFEERKYYRYDSVNHIPNTGERIFLVNGLPSRFDINKKEMYINSMIDSVDSNSLYPFILFINNRAIKWSDITIISNVKYTYLSIKNVLDIDINSVYIMRIPYKIRYGEDNIININYKGNFYFDASGKITTNIREITMRIEIISSELICSTSNYSNGYIEVPVDRCDKQSFVENIIIIKDNEISSDSTHLLEDKGYNIFKYNGDTTNTIFKSFFFTGDSSSIDNLYKLNNSNFIRDEIINNNDKQYISNAKQPLVLVNGIPFKKVVTDINPLYDDIKIVNHNSIYILTYIDDDSCGKLYISNMYDDYDSSNIYILDQDCNDIIDIFVIDDNNLMVFYNTDDGIYGKRIIVNDTYLITNNAPIKILDGNGFSIMRMCYLNKNSFVIRYNKNVISYIKYIEFDNRFEKISYNTMSYIYTDKSIIDSRLITINDSLVYIQHKDSYGRLYIKLIKFHIDGAKFSNDYMIDFDMDIDMIESVYMVDNKICVVYNDDNNIYIRLITINETALSMSIDSKYMNTLNNTMLTSVNKVDDSTLLLNFINNSGDTIVSGFVNIYDNNRVLFDDINIFKIDNDLDILYSLFTFNNNILFCIDDEFNIVTLYLSNLINILGNKIKTIMEYNPELIDNIYDDFRPTESISYYGSYIKTEAINGYFTIPRRRYNNIFCNVIIFVNGILYGKYDQILYVNNIVKIPISGIDSDDIMEIIFIKDIDTKITSLIVQDEMSSIDIGSHFNPDNVILFSDEYNTDRIYDIGSDRIVYEVPFSISTDNNIILEDPSYYNKELTVVPKKLFMYKKIIIDSNTVDVPIGEDFKYCTDSSRYLLFINGRNVDQNSFDVAIPSRTNPFDTIVIYSSIILSPDDIVEIIYLPFIIKDTSFINSIGYGESDTNGYLVLDKETLPYSIDNDNYWIYINGKKISSDHIEVISSGKISIKHDYKSNLNIYVKQFIKPIDILYNLFKNDDMWNKIIDLMGDDINKFYDFINLTNTDIDIYNNKTNIEGVILEAFRQYYAQYSPYQELPYDFNDIILNPNYMDSDNNYIVNIFNATNYYNVDVDR